MSDEMLQSCEQIDRLELPLRLATGKIAQIGRIIDGARAGKSGSPPAPSRGSDTGLLALAQSIYRFRRVRDEAFGPKLFSDPTWDMLLDLFIATEQRRPVSISSACISSTAPATTALRHLSALVKNGIVSRIDNEEDRRASWVELTPIGYEKLAAVLKSWER